MYISKMRIKGFRNFLDTTISFNDGLNVLIGHNNAGKSNIIKALSIIFGSGSRRLVCEDLCRFTSLESLKSTPPEVKISVFITQSKKEELYTDDLATVGNWLVRLEPPYEAILTYTFFLPEKEVASYISALENIDDINKAWYTIEHNFMRLYTPRLIGGEPNLLNPADQESIQKFDFQFLDAIRDVERDMFSGKNALLKEVLDFFMDYEIKSQPDSKLSREDKRQEIKTKKETFSGNADSLIKELQSRMQEGKKHILSYANNTGAFFKKASLDFDGFISDVELFSALKLIVEYETGISIRIPATHNGLGYNNLIYMSLLLAKMQVNSDGEYFGSNAKVFPILAIEEPEAHLHPAMQYKLLKFLREHREVKGKVRQIFVSSHSTQITSAVTLDELICLHEDEQNVSVGYPGKAFTTKDGEEIKKSKQFVQRFMDATKSDMLFAQNIILVEGLAEQLLINTIAKYLGTSLEDKHIGVINIGGRYFEDFLFLFDKENANTIPKKVACITDRDPEWKHTEQKNFHACYPFEFDRDLSDYTFRNHAENFLERYHKHPNIRFFSQHQEYGKTFEYELILCNPTLDLLITESTRNDDEIRDLMKAYSEKKSIEEMLKKLRRSKENDRIRSGLESNKVWEDDNKKKALIAARYLNSLGKGENGLELSLALEQNLVSKEKVEFTVPEYIKGAIEWVCQ